MRILVAGATGVVGRLLLPKLVNAGHEVVGITSSLDRKSVIESVGARAVVANAYDRDAFFSVFAEVRPEIVFHQLTALRQRDFAENSRIRVEGTRNLVDAALSLGTVKRIIAQSISWVYESGDSPASEEVSLDLHASSPRKGLVDSVHVLEQTVAEIPDHVILRYGTFYGRDTFYAQNGFVAEQLRRKQLPATEGVTSFLHVEDAASAAFEALLWPAGPVNIVDDDPARGTDWLPVFAQALGAPMPDVQPGRNAWERGASNTKARAEYGWKPMYPTWRTGLPDSLTQVSPLRVGTNNCQS